jgi:MtN3 and saliva related transmembrane protein
MESQQILGIVAGIFTSTSLVPQLVKIIKEKDASNVSVLMLLVLMTGLALWIWYGIEKKDTPIIATNAFSILVNILLLFFRFRYGEKKDEGKQ